LYSAIRGREEKKIIIFEEYSPGRIIERATRG